MDLEKLSKVVSKDDLKAIVRAFADSDKLEALEINGVDNWDWYGDALSQDYEDEYWDEEISKVDGYYDKEVK